jgi:hypothetical protein
MCPDDNDARDKWCPACRKPHRWYETTCPSCGGALVDEGANGAPDPDVELVSVFHISDGAVVPLAKMALEGAGIEYDLRASNIVIPGIRPKIQTGFDADVPGEIFVRADDATRARDLLADLDHPTPPDPTLAEPTPSEWAEGAAAPASDLDTDTNTE